MNQVHSWMVAFPVSGIMGMWLIGVGIFIGRMQWDPVTQIGVMWASTVCLVISVATGYLCLNARLCMHDYSGAFNKLLPPSDDDERRKQQFVILNRLKKLCREYTDAHYAAGEAGCYRPDWRLDRRQQRLQDDMEKKRKAFHAAYYAAVYFGFLLPDDPTDVINVTTIVPQNAKAA